MELNNLSKSDLIKKVQQLESELDQNVISFKNELQKLFSNKKLINEYGNQYLNYVAVTDLSGNYLAINPYLKEVFQKELGVDTVKNFAHLVDSKNDEKLKEYFKNLNESGKAEGVVRSKNKNGEPIYFTYYSKKYKSKSGDYLVLSTGNYVTDYIQTKLELAEKQKELQIITSNSPANILKIDTNHTIKFNNVLTSQKARDMVLEKPIYDFILPEYHQMVRQKINDVIKNGSSVSYELEGINPKTGKKNWYLSYASPIIESETDKITGAIISTYNNDTNKNRELEHKATQQNYRLFTENNPDGVIVHQEGIIKYANEGAAKLVESKSIEELIGKEVMSFVLPEQIPVIRERLKRLFTGQTKVETNDEKIVTLKDNIRDVEISGWVTNFNNEPAIQLVLKDITDKKQAEETEIRFKKIVDTMAEGVLIVDKDDVIHFANEKMCEMSGYDINELLGQKGHKILMDAKNANIILQVNKERADGKSSDYEVQMLKKDGTPFWVHISGTPYETENFKGSIGIITDITKLKISEESQKEILQNIDDIVYRLKIDQDPVNAEVIYASEKMQDIIGFTPAELIKNPKIWQENIHPDDIDELKKRTLELYKSKKNGIREYRFRHKKTKEYIWLEDKIFFKYNHKNEVIEQFGVSHDITERKKAELETQKAHAKFKSLFHSSNDAVLIVLDDEISDCNLGALEFFNLNKKQLTNKKVHSLFQSKYKNQSFSRKIDNAKNGIPQKFEWILNDHNDNPTYVEISTNRLFLENGTFLQLIVKDITAEKQIKEITETSEKSFRELFNNSSDMIFIIGQNGYFIDVNKEVLRTFKYSKKELKAKTTKDMSAPGQDKEYSSKAWKGRQQRFEWMAMTKDGARIPVEIKLKKATYFGEDVLIAQARDISERKQTEEALKASEEKFRRLFSTANDAIFIMNNETFVDCNQQTLKMFNCKKEEIIGHPPYEFSPEYQPDGNKSFDKAVQKIQGALAGKAQRFYWKHITKKGVPFDAEVSLNSFQLSGKVYIQAIVRDITAKVEAENALRESESKFKSIADSAPVLIRMINDQNISYFFSSQYERFLGKKTNQLEHHKWRKLIHKAEEKLVLDTHNQAFKSKLKFEISYRIKNHRNQYRWILETGIPQFNEKEEFQGFITASIDITDRKNAEESLKNEETLRKSNELFRNTLEKISLASISIDISGEIIFCNDYFAKIVNEKKDHLIGKNWFDKFVPKEQLKERKTIFAKRIKTGKMPVNITSKIVTANKNQVIINWSNIFLKDENDEIIGVTSIGEDITQSRQDELIKDVYSSINSASISLSSIDEFYYKAYEQIQRLFEVENIYISVHDEENNEVTFPFFLDEKVAKNKKIAARPFKDSLTEYVIKKGNNVELKKKQFKEVVQKKGIKIKGTIPEQWVAIPLKTQNHIFGILAVQDYKNANKFSKSNIENLTFISNHIALAVQKIQNEELLLKSERQFRNIFENLQDVYYRTDNKGIFTLVSPSVEKYTGLKPADFIGRNIEDFYVDPSKRKKMLDELYKGGFINNFETEIVNPDGEKMVVHSNVKLLKNEKDKVIGVEGMVRDVTQMLKAQQQIRENEEKFRSIFESLQDVYYKADIDGTLDLVSPSVLEVAGYRPEELIGSKIGKLYVDRKEIIRFNNILEKNDNIKNYETLLKKKDGSAVSALANIRVLKDEKGNRAGIEGTIRDISDIRQTEEDLKLFENIIQNNWDAIVFADLAGEVRYINEAANQLYGYSGRELIGQNVDVFNSNLTHNTDDIVKAIQEKGGWVGEIKQKRKNGDVFDAMLSVQLIFNKKGEPIGLASHSKDISNRKKEELELLQAKELAESSLKVKEQFLANMSHELRTPMNGIIGIAELLKDTPLKKEQDEFVSIIQKSSENLLNILNDILDLSKIEAGKIEIIPSPASLEKILVKTLSLFEYQATNKKIELKYHLDNTIPNTLLLDETRLIQILSNLVSNAIKFTQEGSVSIEVKNFKIEDNYVRLLFKVIDTGLGIKEEEFSKLFSYFSQLDNTFKKQHKGTGLGLAISKELAVLMGGEIGIQSKEGHGSTFWFTIKAATVNKDIEVDKTTIQINGLNVSSENVLIVDDNKTNLLVAEKLIGKFVSSTTTADSGEKAIKLASKNDYDLIFMDIQMPEMDGIEAMKEIKKLGFKNPIIAMTAYAMKTDRGKFMKLGFDDYLAKPVNSKTITKILHKWAKPIEKSVDNNAEKPIENNKTIQPNNSALEQLRSIGGDDFVNEVIKDFDEETSMLIKEIKTYYKNDDWEGMKSHFHTLKGSSGTIGLLQLSECCKRAEDQAKGQEKEKIKATIQEIEKLFNIFMQEFIQ